MRSLFTQSVGEEDISLGMEHRNAGRSPFRNATDFARHAVMQEEAIGGGCSSTGTQKGALLSLAMADLGTKMTIKGVAGGKDVRARLFSMGIRQGESVEIITSQGAGRLIVRCGELRLALGRDTTQKIMVSFP
jgi:Fur family ferric uptake transcriptional regulator